MTNRFPRPVRAISTVEQIPVGTCVWHVYGIWPLNKPSAYKVVSAPYRSKYDIDLIDIFYLRDDGTPQLNYAGAPLLSQKSLLDANIGKDNVYNDNYMFLSRVDAESCVRWFNLLYALDPKLIKDEIRRKNGIAHEWNSYHYDDTDCYMDLD